MRTTDGHTNRCVSGTYFGSVGKWPHQLLIDKPGGMVGGGWRENGEKQAILWPTAIRRGMCGAMR